MTTKKELTPIRIGKDLDDFSEIISRYEMEEYDEKRREK